MIKICAITGDHETAVTVAEKAIDAGKRLVANNPAKGFEEASRAYSIKIRSLKKLGRLDDALKTCDEMIDYIDSNNASQSTNMLVALHQKASIQMEQEKWPDALQTVNKYLYTDNKVPRSDDDRGREVRHIEMLRIKHTGLLRTGKRSEAEKVQQELKALHPKHGISLPA